MTTPHDTPRVMQPLPQPRCLTGGAAASDPPHQPPTNDQPEGPFRPSANGGLPRELLRVEEAAARLAIGRTSMFALIRTRAIESVKVGRLRRVPVDALTAYITTLTAQRA